MHNIKAIRKNPEAFDTALAKRGLAPLSAKILELDKEKRGEQHNLQNLQSEANKLAKQVGELMAKGQRDEAAPLLARSKELKERIAELKKQQEEGATETSTDDANDKVTEALEVIPNLLADDVPIGKDENDNIEIKVVGKKPEFKFTPKQHFDLGEELGLLDFEQAAKISGSRFAILKGQLSRLERALANFMLDNAANHGYVEHTVPYLVKADALYGTSQLPKFEEDLFKTTDNRYLIPTAEVSLTNLVREKILNAEELPLRLTSYTPCFRSEAGSAGKDTRGLIRQHQFSKVELVSITKPEDSKAEHERMLSIAESVLQALCLHYRVVLLCSGDTGFGSQKTYDIEVWLPGQNAFREISSCSNCGDFQARRMNARYRAEDGNEFVHTLNGSALAVGRTIVAILENYQNEDGTTSVPEKLIPYMNGISKIG
jgi:seryl-tRNA synthetase